MNEGYKNTRLWLEGIYWKVYIWKISGEGGREKKEWKRDRIRIAKKVQNGIKRKEERKKEIEEINNCNERKKKDRKKKKERNKIKMEKEWRK